MEPPIGIIRLVVVFLSIDIFCGFGEVVVVVVVVVLVVVICQFFETTGHSSSNPLALYYLSIYLPNYLCIYHSLFRFRSTFGSTLVSSGNQCLLVHCCCCYYWLSFNDPFWFLQMMLKITWTNRQPVSLAGIDTNQLIDLIAADNLHAALH